MDIQRRLRHQGLRQELIRARYSYESSFFWDCAGFCNRADFLLESNARPVRASYFWGAKRMVEVDPRRRLVQWLIAFWMTVAVAGPSLLAFNLLPSATFYNQALSFLGWGSVIVVLFGTPGVCRSLPLNAGWAAIPGALSILVLAVLASWTWYGLPSTLALSALAMFIAAAACTVAGAVAMRNLISQTPGERIALQVFTAFMTALILAGLLNVAVASVQYFVPSSADQWWIVRSMYGFRASGNLRQPNWLASQLIWAIVALVVMVEWRRWPAWAAVISGVLCLYGVALTGSRMGALLVVLLAVWGAIDCNLKTANRQRLLFAPVAYIVIWLSLLGLANAGGVSFGGKLQVSQADLSNARLGVWRQTVDLIMASPWLGVGWGEFNFAWTLTPATRELGLTFTHSHNLLLQWAAELGLPIASLLIMLGTLALHVAWKNSRSAKGETAVIRSALLVIVVSMVLHSMSEFPLWQAHFLLPTMFAFGAAASPAAASDEGSANPRRSALKAMRLLGWLMAIGAALAVYDYQSVAEIYLPHAGSPPDSERIERGRHSFLYGHMADRYAGTITRPGERSLQPFVRSTHEVLDMRLLIAWALALDEAGETDRARYIAQRVREFDDPVAKQFFAPCETSHPKPFQCDEPKGRYSFRDFR